MFLGLDLSLAGTGIVLLGPDGQRVVAHKHVKTGPSEQAGRPPKPSRVVNGGGHIGSLTQRIRRIKLHVAYILDRYPNISIVAIENHGFAIKGAGKTQLAELHGVVKDVILDYGIPVGLYAATTIKATATGDSNASKADMIMAAKRDGFKACCNDDEADAFWLARHVYFEMEPF